MLAVSMTRVGGPEVLALSTARSGQPGPGQVRVRNAAAGVNHVDTLVRRGEMPPGLMPPLPWTPGVEGSGVIEALGDSVEELAVGDRVAWMGPMDSGGYAQSSVVPATGVVRIGAGLSFEAAAALPVNGVTAWHMLGNLADVGPGSTVLVHAAAGGVGAIAVQLARNLGARVIGSAGAGKADFVRSRGADAVIDRSAGDLRGQIMALTDGRGVDVSLNPVSGPGLTEDIACLAPFGVVIVFGFLGGLPSSELPSGLAQAFGRSVSLRLSDIYTLFRHHPKRFRSGLEEVLEAGRAGRLTPHLHQVLPLERAGEAHRLLESRRTRGKIVLSIAPGQDRQAG